MSIISPLLSNVALTFLDETIRDKYSDKYTFNPIVRYADDFVIIMKTKEQAQEVKSYIGEELNRIVGVELSEDKTRITEINEGFNFLGFNIRKYKNGKAEGLMIKPSKENVKKVIEKLRLAFDSAYEIGISIDRLIRSLNPIIRGWGNYYRHFVAKRTFQYVTDRVWKMTVGYLFVNIPINPRLGFSTST